MKFFAIFALCCALFTCPALAENQPVNPLVKGTKSYQARMVTDDRPSAAHAGAEDPAQVEPAAGAETHVEIRKSDDRHSLENRMKLPRKN